MSAAARMRGLFIGGALLVTTTAISLEAGAQQGSNRSADRGTGISSSMFGTYIMPRELLVYPYYEYYLDNKAEYGSMT